MDELAMLISKGVCCCLWTHGLTPVTLNVITELKGFQLAQQSGERTPGALAVFLNNRRWNMGHITIKEQLCSKDIEPVAISMRPYHLPGEFCHVTVVTVYCTSQPAANRDVACDVLRAAVSRLQTQHPSVLLIPGDFSWEGQSGRNLIGWRRTEDRLRQKRLVLVYLHLVFEFQFLWGFFQFFQQHFTHFTLGPAGAGGSRPQTHVIMCLCNRP